MPLASYVAAAILLVTTAFVGHITGFETYRPDLIDVYLFVIIVTIRTLRGRYRFLLAICAPLEACVLTAYTITDTLNLSYAVQIFNNNLQDGILKRFDNAVGYNYNYFISHITQYERVFYIIGRIYGNFSFLSVSLLTCGLLFYRERQIAGRFYVSFVFAVIITCAVSALIPAQGEVIFLDPQMAALVSGASPLDHLDLLRTGQMHKLPSAHGGIISFPSMHVGLGLLLLYYTYRTRLFYVFAIPSVLLIVSAFTHGAHYLADGLAAAPVIALSCLFTDLLFKCTQYYQAPLARQPGVSTAMTAIN